MKCIFEQVTMTLKNEDSGNEDLWLNLKINGMNAPSACTIVFIAGTRCFINLYLQIYSHL